MKTKLISGLLCIVFLMFFSKSYAQNFGAPEPLARDGNVSLGVGYAYYENEYQDQSSDNLFKVRQNLIYAQLNVFYRYIEFYARAGGADLKVDDAFRTSQPGAVLTGFDSEFQDGYKPYFAVGAKGAWEFHPHFSLGPFFQASYFLEHKDRTSGIINGVSSTQELKIGDYYKADIGVFLQAKVKPFIFYAGPFAYVVRGDIKATGGNDRRFEEDTNFGGAAGLRINVAGALNLELEAQYTEKFSAGGMVSYSF